VTTVIGSVDGARSGSASSFGAGFLLRLAELSMSRNAFQPFELEAGGTGTGRRDGSAASSEPFDQKRSASCRNADICEPRDEGCALSVRHEFDDAPIGHTRSPKGIGEAMSIEAGGILVPR
jgi:hypothetical protein